MRRGTIAVALVVIALAAIAGGYLMAQVGKNDELVVALPNAIGVVEGTPVQVRGFDVGRVSSLTVRGDKALATLALTSLPAPLHAGTTATVEWRSLLGERYIQLQPGPEGNPALPGGAMIQASGDQVVVEDLLESLDPPTRAHLSSTLRQLDAAMAGHQQDFNQTLRTAGPSVQALGAVLNAVGSDGQAIKTVLANLHRVTDVLAARRGALSSTVADLNRMTSVTATHQQQLSDGLAQLPSTLDSAKSALDKIPGAADSTVPLLHDLRPAADRLPGVTANLKPVMHDLRPTLRLLRPTLEAADDLLDKTPAFLDEANHAVPKARETMQRLGPAVAFLRPYTPELMGFLVNWGGAWSDYDSQGNYINVLPTEGKDANNDSPPGTIPGEQIEVKPVPGQVGGQPWTDANGSGPR
jgi:phospholipid/cholesterol/gamma-HCH transport system substrate-binding protein